MNMEICWEPSENNLMAFVIEKKERVWYNCAEEINVKMEMQRSQAVLYVYVV